MELRGRQRVVAGIIRAVQGFEQWLERKMNAAYNKREIILKDTWDQGTNNRSRRSYQGEKNEKPWSWDFSLRQSWIGPLLSFLDWLGSVWVLNSCCQKRKHSHLWFPPMPFVAIITPLNLISWFFFFFNLTHHDAAETLQMWKPVCVTSV